MDRERRPALEEPWRAVDAALADSAKKREKAIAAGERPDPLGRGDRGGPPRRVAPRGQRREPRAAASGSADSSAELVRERDAAEAAEKDRRIVERLAAILNDFGVHGDERKADADYAAAFRAYGVDLDSLDPGGRRPAARREPGRRGTGERPRSVGDSCVEGGCCTTRRGPIGWSRWRGRPIPTRGGTACATRSAGMEGGPARRLEVLERLAATADVEHLPVASVTRLATSLAIFGRATRRSRCSGGRRPRIATTSGSTPTWVAS